jgi:type I restriction enzyme S subunit
MSERTSTVSLGSATTKIGSGATPRGGSHVYESTGTAFIRSQNVYDNHFEVSGLAFITDEAANALRNVTVEPGDVLLNITGDSVARCCLVPDSILPARVSQHVMIIRPDPQVLDGKYLQSWIVSNRTKRHLITLAGAGATRPALTKEHVENLALELPSLTEQRAIASVLGSLDDKIESNHRIGGVCWSLASASFDALIAKADEFVPLGSVLSLAYGKALPARSRIPGPTPVFGSGGVVGWHNNPLVSGPGIVVGRKGTVGVVHWCQTDFFPIDTTFYVDASSVPLSFAFFLLRSLRLDGMNSDSAVPGLNRTAALARTVPVIGAESLEDFNQLVEPLINTSESAGQESRILSVLRDTLLPKFLSGELSVRNADSRMEAAV